MNILYSLRRLSERGCEFLERRLPHAQVKLSVDYDECVAAAVRSTSASIVVDAGGGQMCGYAKELHRQDLSVRLIAVDISPAELAKNSDTDEIRISDLNQHLPFADGEVDVLTSSHLIEHLTDPESFIKETHRVLRPGGLCVHIVPCRFAPFALIKQAMPQAWSVALVKRLVRGQSAQFCWAPVYYRRCYPSAMRRLLKRQGFECVADRTSYYQAGYFKALAPLFLLMSLYELVNSGLQLKNLGAYYLVVARKQAVS